MATAGTLKFDIIVDDNGTATIKDIDGKIVKLGDDTEKATKKGEKGFKSMWGQMALGQVAFNVVKRGLTEFKNFLRESIDLAGQQELAEAQLNNVIKSTGGAAGLTAAELKSMATELQGVTTFGDEAVIGAESLLLTFTNIGRDVFPAATKTVLDMSQALGQDLKSSSVQLGKALNDPVLGITALSRVGVSFTESQKDVIKSLVKTGDTAGAQQVILAELNKEFGGSAQAAAETYAGKMKQLGNRFGDFQEVAGSALLDVVLPAMESLVDFIKENEDEIIDVFNTVIQVVQDVAGVVIDVVSGAVSAVTTLWNALGPVTAGLEKAIVGLGVLLTDQLGNAIDQETAALLRNAEQVDKTRTNYQDMRTALGLTTEQLQQMRKDFGDIEDPAVKMNKIMRAIRDGKYDTDIRKLSKEYDSYKQELKETRDSAQYFDIIQKTLDGTIEKSTGLTKEQKKEIAALKKEYDSFADKLGILTDQGVANAQKEIGLLTTVFEDFGTQISLDGDKTNDFSAKIDDLIGTFQSAGMQVPTELEKLRSGLDRTKDAEEKLTDEVIAAYGAMEDFTKEIEGGEENLKSYTPKLTDAEKKQIAFNAAVNSAIGISDAFGRTLAQVGGFLEDFGIISEKSAGGLSQMSSGAGAVSSGMKQMKESSGGIIGLFGDIGGAVTGLSGALSIATGVFSFFAGLLEGKSGQLEAAERRIGGLELATGDWAEKIEAAAMELNGLDTAGRAFNEMLADMIGESTITLDNYDVWIGKIRDIGAAWQEGAASFEETGRNYGAAFDAMLQKTEELGIVGNAAFIGLIENAEELGLNVREIADFIDSNMKSAVDGWREAIKTFGDASLPVFDNIIILQDKIAENDALVNSILGAEQALLGLSATTRLTEQQFDVFEKVATDAFDNLMAAGFTAQEALAADTGLQGLLQQLIFLQGEYGLTVDDSTQALIDMGIEQGLLSKDSRTQTEIMTDAFESFGDQLERLIELLGGGMTGAFSDLAGAAVNDFGDISTAITGTEQRVQSLINSMKHGGSIGMDNIIVGGGGGNIDAGFAAGTPPGGFVVPPGHPNDSFRMGLTSGEEVFVNPKGKTKDRGLANFVSQAIGVGPDLQSAIAGTGELIKYIGSAGGQAAEEIQELIKYVDKTKSVTLGAAASSAIFNNAVTTLGNSMQGLADKGKAKAISLALQEPFVKSKEKIEQLSAAMNILKYDFQSMGSAQITPSFADLLKQKARKTEPGRPILNHQGSGNQTEGQVATQFVPAGNTVINNFYVDAIDESSVANFMVRDAGPYIEKMFRSGNLTVPPGAVR